MRTISDTQAITSRLVALGLVDEIQAQSLEARAKKANANLLDYLEASRTLDEDQLTRLKADLCGVQYVNLSDNIDTHNLRLIPKQICQRYRVLALGVTKDNHVAVAMLDTDDIRTIKLLQNLLKRPVTPFLSSPSSIDAGLHIYETMVTIDTPSPSLDKVEKETAKPKAKTAKVSLTGADTDSKVANLFQTIINFALGARASDIHVEPTEARVRIRYRIDGVLQEIGEGMSLADHNRLVSYVKIKSHLKIDERRLPQDGQINMETPSGKVDFRIAFSPTVFGEQLVIRILSKSEGLLTLNQLGYMGAPAN